MSIVAWLCTKKVTEEYELSCVDSALEVSRKMYSDAFVEPRLYASMTRFLCLPISTQLVPSPAPERMNS